MANLQAILLTFVGIFISFINGQSISVGNNIYDSLTPLGCTQFLSMIASAGDDLKALYLSTVEYTVFVANDSAFQNLPVYKRNKFLNMTPDQQRNYVLAFTVNKIIQAREGLITEERPEQSMSGLRTKLFFNIRSRREGNSASGVAGPTEYFVNGANIMRPNIQAGRAMIQMLSIWLDPPSEYGLFGYISLNGQPHTAFYRELLQYLAGSFDYYSRIFSVLNQNDRVTAFIPTDDVIAKIPLDKLNILRSNPARLNDVIMQHIIPDRIYYTSFVYHNEGAQTMKSPITFRTSAFRETVFVTGGKVTAEVTSGNITVMNGCVHFISSLLGYVYNSAKDEIELNADLSIFEEIMLRARDDLQKAIAAPSGVTIFLPVNQAFNNLPNARNLYTNQSLINMIVELCLLQQGYELELTSVNGDYESRLSPVSRYFNQKVNIYSQGNETWVESGYVKARVIRPDVGVINGIVHFIDAVPGVPSRDVFYTIFCEDWLIKSSIQLRATGLDAYLRDPTVQSVAPCARIDVTNRYPVVSNNNTNYLINTNNNPQSGYSQGSCGEIGQRCLFTVFIPNGTAFDSFENQQYGRQLQADRQRYRSVLLRHITRQIIYIDKTAVGVERYYTAVNGDQVRYRRANDRYAYLYYRGKESRILHSDLGATNGIVHIVDQVIFDVNDLTGNFSSTSQSEVPDLRKELIAALQDPSVFQTIVSLVSASFAVQIKSLEEEFRSQLAEKDRLIVDLSQRIEELVQCSRRNSTEVSQTPEGTPDNVTRRHV